MSQEAQIQELMKQYGVDSEDALLSALQQEQTSAAAAPAEDEVIRVYAKPMLNIKEWAEHEGAKLVGSAPNGNAILETTDNFGETVNIEFDANAFLKSEGQDPSQWNIMLNSPVTATDESALGFADALRFEYRSDQASRLKFLTERFGEDNIWQGEKGEIKIKDTDGIWKRADTSFMQTLGADAPAITASVGGASIGGGIGAAIGGTVGAGIGLGATALTGGAAAPFVLALTALGATLGTTLGAAFGGATSYVAARWGTRELAKKAGLITEEDVSAFKDQIGMELGTNLAVNLLLPPALKAGGKALSKVATTPIITTGAEAVKDVTKMVGYGVWATTKPVAGLLTYPFKVAGKTYDMFTSGPQMAEMLKSVFPKVKPGSWETMLHSKQHLAAVQGYVKELDGWVRNPKTVGEIDPVINKMAGTVDYIFKRSKELAQGEYKRSMDLVKPSIYNLPIDLHKPIKGSYTSSVTNFVNDLKGLGLVDDAQRFMPPELAERAVQVVPPGAERESLKALFDIAKKLQSKAEVPMNEVEQALAAVDNVLDKADVFAGNPRQISTQVERLLIKFRSELTAQASDQLRGRVKVRTRLGQEVDAGTLYQQTKQKYHEFRKGQEDFLTSLRGNTGNKDTLLKALARNFENPEVDFMSNFRRMTGGNEFLMDKLVELERMNAARDIALNGYGLSGFKGPIAHVFGVDARGVAMSRAATWSANIANKKTPQPKASFESVFNAQALGKASAWFKDLSSEAKQQLLSNPQAMDEFRSVILNAGGTANLVKKEIDQQLGKR